MVSIQFIVCLYNSLEHRPSTQIFSQLLSNFCHVNKKSAWKAWVRGYLYNVFLLLAKPDFG